MPRISDRSELRLFALAALFSAVVLLFGIPALAASELVGDTLPLWAQICIGIAAPVGTWLIGKLAQLLAMLADYISQRLKMAWIAQIDDYIMVIVSELWRTEVRALKEAAADGKLTAREKEGFKLKAIDSLKSQFGVKKLSKALGGPEAIGARIETNLAALKQWGPQNPL